MSADISEMVLLAPGLGTPLKLVLPAGQSWVPLGIAYFGEVNRGLLRSGFVVVGDAVIADGSVSSCMRLWTSHEVIPAFQSDQMLVVRDVESGSTDGSIVVELTNAQCDVLLSVTTSNARILGQLSTGEIVTDTKVLSWNGSWQELDVLGNPVGLIEGRYLISFRDDSVLVTDLRNGQRVVHLLEFTPELARPIYNESGSRMIVCQEFSGALVIDRSVVDQHQFDHPCVSAMWGASGDPTFILEDVEFGLAADPDRRLSKYGVDRFVLRSQHRDETTWTNSSEHRPILDVTGRVSALTASSAHQESVVVGALPHELRDELVARAKDRFRAAADEADVSQEVLMSLVSPSILLRLAVAEADADIPIGATHFGGQPDVPDSFEWMTFHGRPYSFLAQLRCDELCSANPGLYLPSDGWLLVFVDLNESGETTDDQYAVNVAYLPEQPVSRRSFPAEILHTFPGCWVGMVPSFSLPPWEDLLDTYGFEAAEILIDATRSPWPEHRLFGHPDLRSGSVYGERSFLMKIATDDCFGAVWLGGGWLNIDVPKGVDLVSLLEDCNVHTLGVN